MTGGKLWRALFERTSVVLVPELDEPFSAVRPACKEEEGPVRQFDGRFQTKNNKTNSSATGESPAN